MGKYREMQTFVAVVESGSFVGAVEALGSSKAAVSRQINDLETRLGLRLLHRTTRKLSLTDEGHLFYSRCREALALVDDAEAEITSSNVEPRGMLHVSAPLSFGVAYLAPLWARFLGENPKVNLDINLSDRMVDLVEEGFDLAVRIANLPNSTLVSRRLATTRMVLCASPQYLERHGVPARPEDLVRHDIASYALAATGDQWTFQGRDGPIRVRTRPILNTNNGDTCRALALEHRAVVLQPSFMLHRDIREGRLIEIMPEYRSGELGIYAMYASRKHLPPKVRKLVDFLAEAFQTPPWADI